MLYVYLLRSGEQIYDGMRISVFKKTMHIVSLIKKSCGSILTHSCISVSLKILKFYITISLFCTQGGNRILLSRLLRWDQTANQCQNDTQDNQYDTACQR